MNARVAAPKLLPLLLPLAALPALLLLGVSLAANAQTVTILHQFGATAGDGRNPDASLTLVGSTLYGTTAGGGTNSAGTVFAINTDGSGYTILHQFGATAGDGKNPNASLTLVGSTLYGTTYSGGTNLYYGTVFAINTGGSGYTILHSFAEYPDGAYPKASLTLVGSTLYGTTWIGGTGNDAGTVFAINTDGSGYTILDDFQYPTAGGFNPAASFTAAGSTLYGTTVGGGTNGVPQEAGIVFAINTGLPGYTILHEFGPYAYGGEPYASLTLVGSTLYGTTSIGGTNSDDAASGVVFAMSTDGSGFTILHEFPATDSDGYSPLASLTLVGSNTLYGTTSGSIYPDAGTVFAINTDGSGYTIMHQFGATASDGAGPKASLTLVGSTLYGTTDGGGTNNAGTVFALSLPSPLQLTITSPTSGQAWSNAIFTVTGTATDNVAVANVFYSLNSGGWSNAVTANIWANWTANVTLTPGSNTIAAYAVDTTGNLSPTNTVTIDYVPPMATLSVSTNGVGSLSTNYNGALLQVGNSFAITATAGTGFVFTNWTGGTNLPMTVLTNGQTLQFVMEPNLMLQANFRDLTKPAISITNVPAGTSVSNAIFTVRGTASDTNWQVAKVFYSLNSGPWSNAASGNNWSNWTATVSLAAGTNTIAAYAVDPGGQASPTANANLFLLVTNQLQVRTVGLGTVSPTTAMRGCKSGGITASPPPRPAALCSATGRLPPTGSAA